MACDTSVTIFARGVKYQFCSVFNLSHHSCDKCHVKCPQDTRARDRKKEEVLRKFGHLQVMTDCEWLRIKAKLPRLTSKYSPFFYSNKISEHDLKAKIKTGEFFGLVNCSITTPPEIKRKFAEANFPPIFKRSCPDLSDLSDSMRDFYTSYNTKPRPQLTVGYRSGLKI